MSTIHVVPIADLIDHDMNPECACGPQTEAVWRDDGSNGWLISHASLDGREDGEPEAGAQRWCVTYLLEAV